jgi:hypothetical protein
MPLVRGVRRIAAGLQQMMLSPLALIYDNEAFHQPRLTWETVLLGVFGRKQVVDLGPVTGMAGEVKTIDVKPRYFYFKAEYLKVTDSLKGNGSRVSTISIGQRLQRPAGVGAVLTSFFDNSALGKKQFDIWKRRESFLITVSFIKSCVFDATLFGRAIL